MIIKALKPFQITDSFSSSFKALFYDKVDSLLISIGKIHLPFIQI